jgi:hypothetical protein
MPEHRLTAPVLTLLFATAVAAACDSGEKKSIADQIGPPTKSINEIKGEEVSKEELEKRRKELGFRSKADIQAEEAAKIAVEMEKGEREYIKSRAKDYKKLNEDTKKFIDDLEKEAGKWAAAKDPDKAFEKGAKPLQDRMRDLIKEIDRLSERSTKGGNTQAIYNKLFRPLDELVKGSLGPQISAEPAFTEALKSSRTELENVTKAVDEIEKDETLEVNKFVEGEDEDTGKKKKKGK